MKEQTTLFFHSSTMIAHPLLSFAFVLATLLHYNIAPAYARDDERELNTNNGPLCKKFKFNGTPHQFYPGTPNQTTGPENYSADDGNGGTITLKDWCSSLENPCCDRDTISYSDYIPQRKECAAWSDEPDTTYEVCENSCNNYKACYGVAKNSSNGSYIKFEAGSCSHTQHEQEKSSCEEIAYFTTKKLNLVVSEGSCNHFGACNRMALFATNLEELVIGKNACTQFKSCYKVAFGAKTNVLVIESNQCNGNSDCNSCRSNSNHGGGLQITTQCCVAREKEDALCNVFSESPSVSSQPSVSSAPSVSNQPSSLPSVSNQPSTIPSDIKSKASKTTPSLCIFIFISCLIVMYG